MKKIFIRTFGCQMNDYDTEVAMGLLQGEGYQLVDSIEGADIVLFNTCSVRQHAEDRVWGKLGELAELKKRRPGLIIGLLGCMAENYKESLFKSHPQLDLICGPRKISTLPALLEELEAKRERQIALGLDGKALPYSEYYGLKRLGWATTSIRAYLPIMTGCDKFCSYCIVPYVRGREVSNIPEEVKKETQRLAKLGYKEIVLLGQNVNSYGQKFKIAPATKNTEPVSFSRLLRELAQIEGIERIGFITSHPADTWPELFLTIRDSPKVSRRFHLPLQSGSDRILKLMKRQHSGDDYQRKIELLRNLVPDISLTTDIIVGFPTESEEDYQKTVALLQEIEFDNAYIFKYSPREGTNAFKLKDDLPWEVKKERNRELLDIQAAITTKKNQKLLGQKVKVLIEAISKKNTNELLARSWQEKKVVFSAQPSLVGKVKELKLKSLQDETFIGELL